MSQPDPHEGIKPTAKGRRLPVGNPYADGLLGAHNKGPPPAAARGKSNAKDPTAATPKTKGTTTPSVNVPVRNPYAKKPRQPVSNPSVDGSARNPYASSAPRNERKNPYASAKGSAASSSAAPQPGTSNYPQTTVAQKKPSSSSNPNGRSPSNIPNAKSTRSREKRPVASSLDHARKDPEENRTPNDSPQKAAPSKKNKQGADVGDGGGKKRARRGARGAEGAPGTLSLATCTVGGTAGKGHKSNDMLVLFGRESESFKSNNPNEMNQSDKFIYSSFVATPAKNTGIVPTTPVSEFTPTTENPDDWRLLLEAGVSSARGVDVETMLFLARYIGRCNFFQSDISALKGVTSQTSNILSCPCHTHDKMIPRVDINGERSPCKRLPIMARTPANKELHERFVAAIMELLVTKFGMKREHTPLVRIKILKWLEGAGMGYHPDSAKADSEFLHFMRLCVRLGGPQRVHFKLKGEGKKEGAKNHKNKTEGVKDIGHSIQYSDVAHAYLTSSYGNGSEPLARFEVEGKTTFVQAIHAVQAVPMGGEESMTIIIDFPLASVELVAKAMAFMRDWEFSLQF